MRKYSILLGFTLLLFSLFLGLSCRKSEKSSFDLNKHMIDSLIETKNDENVDCCVDSVLYSYLFPHDTIAKRDYSSVVTKYIRIFKTNRKLVFSEIEQIVPRTKQEYWEYYNLLKNENSEKDTTLFFHYIDHTIYKNAYNGDTNAICIVLSLARFLDVADNEEFAQVHWDMTQDIVCSNISFYQQIMCLFKNDNETKSIYEDFVSF